MPMVRYMLSNAVRTERIKVRDLMFLTVGLALSAFIAAFGLYVTAVGDIRASWLVPFCIARAFNFLYASNAKRLLLTCLPLDAVAIALLTLLFSRNWGLLSAAMYAVGLTIAVVLERRRARRVTAAMLSR